VLARSGFFYYYSPKLKVGCLGIQHYKYRHWAVVTEQTRSGGESKLSDEPGVSLLQVSFYYYLCWGGSIRIRDNTL
jgi:hypothetical protein